MFNRTSYFKEMVTLFLGLVLTFADDMLYENMSVLVECHKVQLALVEQKLDCGQIFEKIFTKDGWNFPLICRRACEDETVFAVYNMDTADVQFLFITALSKLVNLSFRNCAEVVTLQVVTYIYTARV